MPEKRTTFTSGENWILNSSSVVHFVFSQLLRWIEHNVYQICDALSTTAILFKSIFCLNSRVHTLTAIYKNTQTVKHALLELFSLLSVDSWRRFTFLLSDETTTPKLCSCTTNSTYTCIWSWAIFSCVRLHSTIPLVCIRVGDVRWKKQSTRGFMFYENPCTNCKRVNRTALNAYTTTLLHW